VEITEVRVKLIEEPGERLKAFCSITFDDAFVVRDLKIIEGSSGPFVAMPSRKLTSHCPYCGCKNHLRSAFCNQCGKRLKEGVAAKDEDGRAKLYADIAHPINSTCRELIQTRVIEAFDEEKSRAKLPGYSPSYEEFDYTEVSTSGAGVGTRTAQVEPTKVHQAEKPRGPQKMPAHQSSSTGDEPDKGGFGKGIF